MGFYQQIKYDQTAPIETTMQAVVNVLNGISKEMSIGRVPQNKEQAKQDVEAVWDEMAAAVTEGVNEV